MAKDASTAEDNIKLANQLLADAKPRVQKEPVPGRYDDVRARGGRVTSADLRKKHGCKV